MRRTLSLRRETLGELNAAELAAVHGASAHFTIDTYVTHLCLPLAYAVAEAARRGATRLSVVDCP